MVRWEEVALGNLTKDHGLVMRGQGWSLGEEEVTGSVGRRKEV